MNEHHDIRPTPEGDCGFAKSVLRELWMDGQLSEIKAVGGDAPGRRVDRTASSREHRGLVDSAILRHLDGCPSCRHEAHELRRLGESLEVGLESLCGAIAERMDEDIEGTLEKLRGSSGNARLLRRIRRPIRLVLWISFLAFTLLASVTLAVAVYRALKGL